MDKESEVSDETACCAHLRIKYFTREVNGLTSGWWACIDCRHNFAPISHNYDALAAELAEAKRRLKLADEYYASRAEFDSERDALRAALETALRNFEAFGQMAAAAFVREALRGSPQPEAAPGTDATHPFPCCGSWGGHHPGCIEGKRPSSQTVESPK
jgi:hypothetical protein